MSAIATCTSCSCEHHEPVTSDEIENGLREFYRRDWLRFGTPLSELQGLSDMFRAHLTQEALDNFLSDLYSNYRRNCCGIEQTEVCDCGEDY